MDYPVPDFGVDHDIISTQSHIKASEESTGNTWNLKKDDDGNYTNIPHVDAEFKLVQKNNKKGLA
jgi:hypothetical protein